MIDLVMTRTSTRYVWLPFRGVEPSTGLVVDITGAALKAALVRGADLPGAADWVAADHDGERTINGRAFQLARVLVGTGGTIEPGPGDWAAWVQVALGDETVEEPCGTIRVT